MSEDPDARKPSFGRYLAGFAFVAMLAFVFLNYRDPWPPIVPQSLAPPPDVPTRSNANTLSLAPPPASSLPKQPGRPEPPESTAGGAEAIPTTSLPLRLLATMVQEDPSSSLARIADAQSSGAQMLLPGQVFEGRPHVKLIAIESDSILLDNDGTPERLPLEPGGLQLGPDSSRNEY